MVSKRFAKILPERIDAMAGLSQLTRMVGIQSTKAGTDFEADTLAQEAADIRQNMYGDCGPPMDKRNPDDEMRDLLAAGPVTINQDTKNTGSKALAGGLAALALGAAITIPMVAWNLTKGPTTPETIQPELGARFVPIP